MIKAVIFDLDDTLYSFRALDREAGQRVQKLACRELGITQEQYEKAYLFGRNETKKQLGDVAASHNRILYYQKTLEYLGANSIPLALQMYETYWGTLLNKMELRDGARKFLDDMHEHEIRVMICTDLTAHIQHRKIEALGIAKDLCCLVTSEEAGTEKPAQGIFDLCLRKLKLPAKDVCFIGDHPVKDVEGARTAGMQAIWFDPEKPSAEQFAKAAERILSDRICQDV